jgi:hypothetical protein
MSRFVITLEPRLKGQPGQAGIHRLRALLKRLLRNGGLVCVDAREERPDAAPANPTDTSTDGGRR